MNRYTVTIRYVTPSGIESCYLETDIPASSPWEAIREAKEGLLRYSPHRKVKAITSASCEACEGIL